ncbi:MAG: 23S rRNA (uracil(1939)-C(5))-methyltransferase RlmD [Lachnospiraceae bacterium]|jgi:23S rRNA (uracil-5-)-methyltransferase RumA|nr:23S rRNA (uracil(1939)-C(5))-methyltransferase RlmD [Lachnospiraceae bacterium]
MKKGQVYEGIVERVKFPNKGIVRIGEEICSIPYALPGQKVSFRILKVKHGNASARLLEVIERSPLETGQLCSSFGACGGCTYLSLAYDAQLRIKEEQVHKMLTDTLRSAQGEWIFEGIKASPIPYAYRNKMEFSFGDECIEGPLTLGMHKRGSFYDVVSVEDCLLVDADYKAILIAVRDYFAKQQTPYYHRVRKQGYLRHLLVRKGLHTKELLIALITTSQEPQSGLVEGFKQRILSLKETGQIQGVLSGILHIVNDAQSDVVKCDQMQVLYGKESFQEQLLGLSFEISLFSFFQTNTYGAEVLYQTVRDYVTDRHTTQQTQMPNTIFDLYCGTGTITQLLSPVAKKVVGVELVEEAVTVAKRNANRNGLHNCEFYAGDVGQVLETLTQRPDLIVLDPPRNGVHPKALTQIIEYGVDRIVYISCKPTSLVRDLQILLDAGYEVKKAVAIDQFPWTDGVETVCLIQKRPTEE